MKSLQLFVCQKCDAQTPKWQGRCPECGAWGSLQAIQSTNLKEAGSKPALLIPGSGLSAAEPTRLKLGLEELDRVFGGGLVPGSLILLGGEPGIGKSTLVAHLADRLSQTKIVVYASGEESPGQISLRLKRLGCRLENWRLIADTDIDAILSALKSAPPALLIIDSIQTVTTGQVAGEAGSLSQIRAVTAQLLAFAKSAGTAIIIIGHITKDGQVAGPKTLEHLVDTVLYLETDPSQTYRLLRASKNRFGSTNEVGIFEMTGQGLLAVDNSTALFLNNNQDTSGSAISAVMEGSRPFLVEVQALTPKTVFGYPQRRAAGFDLNRLQVLAAVIMKRGRINVGAVDIILNIAGGLKLSDPGLDLAVSLAIVSSVTDKIIAKDTIIIGEIGLGGEIRAVPALDAKLQAAAKLGFTRAIAPAQKNRLKVAGLEILHVAKMDEAIGLI